MKKNLLLGSALLLSLSAFPQNSKVKPQPTGITNMAEKLALKYSESNNPNSNPAKVELNPTAEINQEAEALKTVNTTAATWQTIGGSMNIYGVLYSSSKPLNYNDDLNAVSFIHRKSTTYTASPVSNSGAIIAEISTNWGASWGTSCIWSDANRWARYPQGGIYNPSGGTNINNAYAVGMGPVTDPSPGVGWTGSWYASKQLGLANYNTTASAVPGAQQFVANTPTFAPGLAKHDFPYSSFNATDDGLVRTIAGRYFTFTGGQPGDFRGAAIVKGSFNAGTFTWTSDTLMPNFVTQTNGTKSVYGRPQMVWNEAGTHGYVVFIGAASGATGSNMGWQPIVYKTSNSGASWVSIPGIDFNSPAMAPIKAPIATITTNTALEIPWFMVSEGIDLTVDINNKLHIVSSIVGAYSNHTDSMGYIYSFGTEKYHWQHTPGYRPVLYDFIGDGFGAWTYLAIDSLSSEGAGSRPTDGGYAENPWDADPGNSNNKVTSYTRYQTSRTRDGEFIVYTWAESDTNFTTAQNKWNSIPNIKARCLRTTMGSTVTTLSPTKVNVTKPSTGPNLNVRDRAMFHYQSPQCIVYCTGGAGTSSIQAKVPLTVSNSNPYSQLGENNHWYSSAGIDFVMPGYICTGFNQSLAYNVNSFEIFPNPANSKATVAIDVKEEGNVTVNIFNTVGQLVKTLNTNAQSGENKMELDLSGISSGIYLVKVKVGNTTSTKKLIVE